jgi:hypothetical protein
MTFRHTIIQASAATGIILALTPNAFAEINAQAVFDAFIRQATNQGFEITADSVTLQGSDNVVVSGLKIGVPGGDDGFELDSLLMEDVSEAGNGAYVIGSIAAPSFSQTKDGISFSFEGAVVEGYYVPGPDETDPIAKAGLYRQLSVGEIAVSTESGAPIFTLDGITAEMNAYEPGKPLEVDAKVRDFMIDFTNVPEPQARAGMEELGYSKLRGRGTVSGVWDPDSGKLQVSEEFQIDDAAELNIDVDLGGYTAELVAAMQQMQEQMKDQSEQAMGMAMLGLMQQMEINSISIELVDDSATGRVLDYVAKQQGTNRESLVAQAKGILPFALAQLQNPAFAAKVTAAVGTYLDNPKSLSIVSTPASPIPLAQIMAAAMSAPQTLIDVLSVTVRANN